MHGEEFLKFSVSGSVSQCLPWLIRFRKGYDSAVVTPARTKSHAARASSPRGTGSPAK